MIYHEIPSIRPQTPLLDNINSPADLKSLQTPELLQLADELRLYLLYSIGQSGGHFAANLGVIELTIALHYVLNTPQDRLVWDVGHQAYAHKALTGRRDLLPTIRHQHGLTAFPERNESEYDTFGVGHSSTSISAALGMVLALQAQQSLSKTVPKITPTVACVIGDGAMTAGMAFEAMNDAAHHHANLLVILNDNDMSISDSIGGIAKHLSSVWKTGQCVTLDDTGQIHVKQQGNKKFRARKDAPAHTDNLFKAIGFEYFGPIDGHDLPEVIRMLSLLKQRQGPKLLHVYTTKGKGFAPAEADPIGYHAIGKQSNVIAHPQNTDKHSTAIQNHISQSAIPNTIPSKSIKYADVFGQFLCDQAQLDSKLLAITPAMCEGSGMVTFAQQFPQRFFDVAIAEQHAVTLAAGMACEGMKPIVAIYSTFLQRGYDQLIHDVALQNLDVTFAIDRAGLVGEDGPTHAGAYDYAYMRTIPNLVLMSPKDENECRQMLHTAYMYPGPTAVRYPRGAGIGINIEAAFTQLPLGKAEVVFEALDNHPKVDPHKRVAILAFGSMVYPAIDAAKQLLKQQPDLHVKVVNMRFIKPLDTAILKTLLADHMTIVTVEEHAIMGGAGSAVNEAINALSQPVKILNLGLPDRFMAHATHAKMLAACGLDVKGITASIAAFIGLSNVL